jgi:Mg-chelatase subunit ChlD/LysM repeat protein/anti-sigma factor RsiW
MNPDSPQTPQELLEARLTALLLGELSGAEAETLWHTIESDPELFAQYERLKKTVGLVRAVAADPAPAIHANLKLSDDRRQKILAHFKTIPLPEPVIAPKTARMTPTRWLLTAAAALVITCGLVVVLLPAFSRAKSKAVSFDFARESLTRSPQPAAANKYEDAKFAKLRDLNRNGKIDASNKDNASYLAEEEKYRSLEQGFVATAPASNSRAPERNRTLDRSLGTVAQQEIQKKEVAPNPQSIGQIDVPVADSILVAHKQTQIFLPTVTPPAGELDKMPAVALPNNADNGINLAVTTPGGGGGAAGTFGIAPGTAAGEARFYSGTGGINNDQFLSNTPQAGNSASQFISRYAYDALSNGNSVTYKLNNPQVITESGAASAPQNLYDSTIVTAKPVRIPGGLQSVESEKLGPGVALSHSSSAIPSSDLPAEQSFVSTNSIALSPVSKSVQPLLAAGSTKSSEDTALGVPPPVVQPSLAPSSVIPIQYANPSNINLDDAEQSYIVKSGDTLSKIARHYGVSIRSLRTANGIKSDRINIGAKLKIPAQLGTGEPETPKPATSTAPIPQPEVQTSSNAFSTFSLNISDVSFKLAAASLQNGSLPDPAGIRSEEFINAFDYRDPEAAPGVPIAFAFERARDPFAHNRDLLRFSLKTAATGREPGRALNIVLLLDNSGSMERADRVQIIHQALIVLAAQLQPQDTISVVTFARTPRLWMDGLPGNRAGEIAEKIGGLTPHGGTDLEDALKLAYETALRHYLTNGVNRIVLLTDGAANLGTVNPAILKQKAEAERKQGIALDCFGIGWEDYNDDLLEVLSRTGGGRYGFINSPEEAATGFARQLAGALDVAACDVKVQVEFNPGRVSSFRQIGYARHQLTKQQFRDNTVAAAQIGAAEAGNALYTVEVNTYGEGPLATVRCRYRVPGTQDYREQEWSVPFTGAPPSLDQSSASLRLAAVAATFAEWLADSPYAAGVTPDQLIQLLSGVPEVYGADGRPQQLEWMLRQARILSGK